MSTEVYNLCSNMIQTSILQLLLLSGKYLVGETRDWSVLYIFKGLLSGRRLGGPRFLSVKDEHGSINTNTVTELS